MGRSEDGCSSGITRGRAAVLLVAVLLSTGCAGVEPTSEAPATTAESYDQYDSMFADWAPRYADCVREAGGTPRIVGNGIENAVVPGRAVRDGLDQECQDTVGPPPQTPPLTDDFLAGLYELYVEQARCLEGAGWIIPEPPSRQEWVENYGGESWAPLVELMKQGVDVVHAETVCPQPDPNEAERVGRQLQG